MKIGFKVGFSILLSFIVLINLDASVMQDYIPDTTKQITTSNHIDSTKDMPKLYINLSTGLLINSTIGNHPIVNVSLGHRINKNIFNLVYEYRFGDSDNFYKILDNDTLKSVNSYKSSYIGFEYNRLIFRNENHEFYTNTGIGTDLILINKGDVNSDQKIIGGLALNVGVGYTFYINKIHGTNIELLYHYADISNKGGTKIDSNSILLRLSYRFNNDYKKK